MSNIFITDIVGSGTYAVPTDDTELAAATSGLDTLLSGVSNLAYDRVLAWVEDSGGPGGAEGTRSLNCLVEKFTYLTDECPSESEVDTMIAAIEAALEADANITSVGNQQVHIFQAGAYFLWNRDASGGFLYPNTATDDVAVGPFASPTGKWFDDGDLVLGAAAMSGTEKLRIVGSARIDTNGQLIIADSATIPPLNLTERSAAPSAPSAGDIYLDDGTNTGSTSPGWRRYTGAAWEDMGALASSSVSQWNEQNIVHVAPHGNDSNNGDAINLAKLTIASATSRATALSPSSTNRITVLIHPGEYDEGVVTKDQYVDYIGVDREACILKPTGGGQLRIDHDNVLISNLTMDETSNPFNYSLSVSSRTEVEIYNVHIIQSSNTHYMRLLGASELVFRDCIIENPTFEDRVLILDSDGGTYRFFNCIFKGRFEVYATYYFYGCHFQSNTTFALYTFKATTPNTVRMFGCTVRRSGSTGPGISITTANHDWGFIGCDIDAASGTGNDDIVCSVENPGVVQGCIIGTTLSDTVKQKAVARRFVGVGGGIDIYSTLEDALDSLPLDGGIVELTDDYNAGTRDYTPRTSATGRHILEGNGFTITGTGDLDAKTGSVFEIRNINIVDMRARLLGGSMHLRNVNMSSSSDSSYILIWSTAGAGDTIIIDNVHVDGSSMSTANPLYSDTSNATNIFVNDSSFIGRSSQSGSAGAAVYFNATAAVLKAVSSLFVHQGGTGTDYEIDSSIVSGGATVYTQYCMTRTNIIGAAPNVTEGMSTTYNVVDANAGFFWSE